MVPYFRGYVRSFVRKHFHAVRLAADSAPVPAGPLLVVMNHPGWWDPMIGVVLSSHVGDDREHYAVMDAAEVNRYWGLNRVGMFGVEPDSVRGAKALLRTGGAILSAPHRTLWVTGQGRFADARSRPLGLRSGVGHLAARLTTGFVLPVAVEYAFWTERTPEALVRVGDPLPVGDGTTGRDWTPRIEERLTTTLDRLNADAASRDPGRFRVLLAGKSGAGRTYDIVRRLRAWATGRKFDPSHDPRTQP
jgi:1-acyl-sn-glycerol-3-phosphate acyltransferase